ncbi:uncharacterized protein LOC129764661 [Toxorhynchites rutilus septentrionalis]|uniref:uncharacterized protein LOC129764661 n=1 Tax=Toxorhynchites rutilus septentrionalis TaxID=329112 RepID=UPI002479AFAC|nr:uncharacterized protein LOC129764661 [Toxorhynchites rutilus septentrionalis]
MSNPGKCVLAPAYESDNSYGSADDQVYSPGKYVRATKPNESSVGCIYDSQDDPYAAVVDPEMENRESREKVLELEKSIAELADSSFRNREVSCNVEETSNPTTPTSGSISTSAVTTSDKSSQGIRWDNIKPFPKGVPANKMWEAWTKYFENFEIAASLSSVCDPIKRSQLLYISMGDEHQGIVRAAKLRPVSNVSSCYEVFIKNIDVYLKSLTDTSAEHDMFSSMQQKEGESAVYFYARLMEKVWLCGYSAADQDRFVRTQFLKGLRNRELAKAARTYNYDTTFVVQSATRDEALQRSLHHSENQHQSWRCLTVSLAILG